MLVRIASYHPFLVFSLFIAVSFSFSCNQKKSDTILVAVASNAQFAIEEIIQEFNKTNRIRIKTSTGSSGKLCAQIVQGAPFDIFIAADTIYTKKIFEEGIAKKDPQILAEGKLVIWTLKENKNLSFKNLISPDIEHIALANPKTAPYGRAAVEFLQYDSLYQILKDKLVFGESIGQVSQLLHSGAADIVISARSIVESEKMKKKGDWLEIPDFKHSPILQSVVLIQHNEIISENAQRFYNFLYSEKSRNIILKHGYKLPEI